MYNGDLSGSARNISGELKSIPARRTDHTLIQGLYDSNQEECRRFERHISTQKTSSTNYMPLMSSGMNGGIRVVAARGELSLREIGRSERTYRMTWRLRHLSMEPCVSHISGRCLLSNYFTGQNANKGHVPTHVSGNTLWWKRPGPANICQCMKMNRGTLYFNSKVCMIRHIGDLISAGIDSLPRSRADEEPLSMLWRRWRTYRKPLTLQRISGKYKTLVWTCRREISRDYYVQFYHWFYWH